MLEEQDGLISLRNVSIPKLFIKEHVSSPGIVVDRLFHGEMESILESPMRGVRGHTKRILRSAELAKIFERS